MSDAAELYEADILDGSQQQAALLRRVAAGERVNSAELDWPTNVDEVESVGREQLHAVESLLTRALLHMLKSQAWPQSPAVSGWQAEARRFRGDAATRCSPSMRQKIDMARLYRPARHAMPDMNDGQPPLAVLVACPVTLDELLAEP